MMFLIDLVKQRAPEIRDAARSGRNRSSRGFFSYAAATARYSVSEPEILVFAALQVCVVLIAYYIWVQGLYFVDDTNYRDRYVNLLLSCWSLLIILAASGPIGILNACVAASHMLRSQRQESTFLRCFRMTVPHLITLWIFAFADAYITVSQIIERLPKREGRNINLPSELSYYTWKVATAGVLPAIMAGKSLTQAVDDSISLLLSRPGAVLRLRAGYSAICWVIGIATYIATYLIVPMVMPAIRSRTWLWEFYLFAGFPIVGASAAVILFLRPVYVLASTTIYTAYVAGQPAYFQFPARSNGFGNMVVGLAIAGIILCVAILYFLDAPM